MTDLKLYEVTGIKSGTQNTIELAAESEAEALAIVAGITGQTEGLKAKLAHDPQVG